MMVDPASAQAAFEARDRSADGTFVVGVITTRIYCRPSCPARRPRPENVRFFADGAAARVAGLRACLRCRPDEVTRDAAAVSKALALLESDDPPGLQALGLAVGYAPHHFQRVFKRATGLSPAHTVRRLRLARAERALSREDSVTDAIYAAGYSSPSRFYAEAAPALGMQPSAWRRGGEGVTIRWDLAETSLGSVLVAATDKGVCRLAFGEGEAELRVRFPRAERVRGGIDAIRDAAAAACENPAAAADVPLDIGGTAFQRAVWEALRRIPPGETRTYSQIAAAVGSPAAVRAAGTANGANSVAVLIPCHRVIRADGGVGGYAYGPDIKRALLERERRASREPD